MFHELNTILSGDALAFAKNELIKLRAINPQLAQEVVSEIGSKEISLQVRNLLKEDIFSTQNTGAAFLAFVGYQFANFSRRNPISEDKLTALVSGEFSDEVFELFLHDDESGFFEVKNRHNYGFTPHEIVEVSNTPSIKVVDLLACNAHSLIPGARSTRMEFIRQTAINHRIVREVDSRILKNRRDEICERVAGLCIIIPNQGFAHEVRAIAGNISKLSKVAISRIRNEFSSYNEGKVSPNEVRDVVHALVM